MSASITVNAGTDKTAYKYQTIAPFSTATFSSVGSFITNVYYKITGEQDTWTAIPQGDYGSLLEATNKFKYVFNNTGSKIAQLKVVDGDSDEAEDTLTVIVTTYDKVSLPYTGYVEQTRSQG